MEGALNVKRPKNDDTKRAILKKSNLTTNLVNVIKKGKLKRRFPKVLIAGAKKCSTGALRFFLDKHPLIRVVFSGRFDAAL